MSIHEEDMPEVPETVDEAPEAPAVEEVQEEVQEERKVGSDSMVPLSALNESRAQLRQTQSQLAEMRSMMEAMKPDIDEWRSLKSRSQQSQAESEFDSDPLGSLRRQISGLEEKLTTTQQQEMQSRQQAEQTQAVFQSIASQVQEYKKNVPDYDQALQHVLSSRRSELLAMGVPPEHAEMRVAQEAQEIGMSAIQAGINPGEMVYNLAKLRGFDAQKAAKKLQTVTRGQESSGTLSGTSGDAGDSGFSMAEVETMSDKEFDAWWEKNMTQQRH